MQTQTQANLDAGLALLGQGASPTFEDGFGCGASERCIETLWAASHLQAGERILDIGFTMSSLDYLGVLLEARRRLGVVIEAADIIQPDKVLGRYPDAWAADILATPLTIGDVRTAPLPLGAYDLVTCISTIEHIGFDAPAREGQKGAFDRPEDEAAAPSERDPAATRDVMARFAALLRPGGRALISTPMGRGGPATVRDSLGLVARQWEYEAESWREIAEAPGFEPMEQRFFRRRDDGCWSEVTGPADLADRSSHQQPHAHGCALAVLKRV
ncbi:MAG: hypothetical protein AAF869_09720 [Pseudomonadota bacterium]